MHIDYLMKQLKLSENEFKIEESFIYKIFQFCYITNRQITFIRFEKDYELLRNYLETNGKIVFQNQNKFCFMRNKFTSPMLHMSHYFDNYGYDINKIKELEEDFIKTFKNENTVIFISNKINDKIVFKESRSFAIITLYLDEILNKIGSEWEYCGKRDIRKIIEETYNDYFNELEERTEEENEHLYNQLRKNNDETWFKQNIMEMFTDLANGRKKEFWYDEISKRK